MFVCGVPFAQSGQEASWTLFHRFRFAAVGSTRDVNEARTLEAEAEARTLEAEARTFEAEARALEAKAEAKQFWP